MQAVFDFLFGGSNQFITALVSISSIVLALVSFIRSRRVSQSEARLKQVVSPLFDLLEPFMLSNMEYPSVETVSSVTDLINKNLLLSGGKIRDFFDLSREAPDFTKRYLSLCNIIDREYDELCRSLGIPLRSTKYRRRRYSSMFKNRVWYRSIHGISLIVMVIMNLFFAIYGTTRPQIDYSQIAWSITAAILLSFNFSLAYSKR